MRWGRGEGGDVDTAWLLLPVEVDSGGQRRAAMKKECPPFPSTDETGMLNSKPDALKQSNPAGVAIIKRVSLSFGRVSIRIAAEVRAATKGDLVPRPAPRQSFLSFFVPSSAHSVRTAAHRYLVGRGQSSMVTSKATTVQVLVISHRIEPTISIASPHCSPGKVPSPWTGLKSNGSAIASDSEPEFSLCNP